MSSSELDTLRARLRGRYALERELGRGGMGAVYLARDLGLDRLVALKVLPGAVAGDVALRERFLQETRTAASFSHPNIVPVHAVEEHDDLLAFAMGFVEGESLADRVTRSGPLSAREAVRLMLDVTYALSYAHGRGVVHRDIKPDNIMIERATGRALVMDFGIARRIDTVSSSGGRLTRVGEIVGTPEYMSPEQASGDAVDGRSDLYSLGLVAWFALTGKTAVTAENTQKILVKQLTETLPPLATVRPDLPAALADAVDRCVAKDPAARDATANALVEVLEAAQRAAPEIPLPVRLLASELGTVGLLLLFCVSIGVYFVQLLENVDIAGIELIIPGSIMATVIVARVGQVMGDARRLNRLGLDAPAVTSGFRAVMDEAASLRRSNRFDTEILADRGRTVRIGALMFLLAVVSIAVALNLREPVGPTKWRTGPLGVAFLINGLACGSVAWVLWVRSPLRMPVGERLFRLLWLGPVGRALLTFAVGARESRTELALASRDGSSVSAQAPITPRHPATTPGHASHRLPAVTAEATVADRLNALESRLTALEVRGSSLDG